MNCVNDVRQKKERRNGMTSVSFFVVVLFFLDYANNINIIMVNASYVVGTSTSTSTLFNCPDQCWNGNNCNSQQCQSCRFACPVLGNIKNENDLAIELAWDDDYGDNDQTTTTQHQQCRTRLDEECSHRCLYKSDCSISDCASCNFCHDVFDIDDDDIVSSNTSCRMNIQFQDHTEHALSNKSPLYFHRLGHSGRPYFHDGPPLFFHLNEDSTLDYFNTMHGHPLFNNYKLKRRMELAISSLASPSKTTDTDTDTDTDNHNDNDNHTDNHNEYSLQQIWNQIIFDDDYKDILKLDTHGCIIADLDLDGHLDIYITNGANRGFINVDKDFPESYDNLLFWGEPSDTLVDTNTGQPLTMFRGGRQAAIDANVNFRKGRGRFVYLVDVNHDGLFDLFVSQDRGMTNDITPGYFLMNQGNRKWKKDEQMQEYSRTLMLTDADGDGFANEIVLNRSFCYPHRDGPEVDPSYRELGEFSEEMKIFCATRPVGTTAIYRYNHELGHMEEISKPFVNFWAAKARQPACCQHATYDGANNCNAKSMASGDFDNDQLADQILLYKYKMDFYFSTDRVSATEAVVGNPNYIGHTIEFPKYCGAAISLSVLDFDNDGNEEIFVACENAGTFLLYTRDESNDNHDSNPAYKSSWTLNNGCNGRLSLGSINNRFLASPTESDLDELCKQDLVKDWDTATEICQQYQRAGKPASAKTSGISIIDLNNDGFLDIVTSHTFGYMRFFYNTHQGTSPKNRYISFDLADEVSNGIGVTLILHCIDNSSGKVLKQFREITSFLHGMDKHSTKDSKIIFGLGQNLNPLKLVIRWPNKMIDKDRVQELELGGWQFSTFSTDAKAIKLQMQSSAPSMHLSAPPTYQSSRRPSSSPSMHPSAAPTYQTSRHPSSSPSVLPTISPSISESPSGSSIPTQTPIPSLNPSVTTSPSQRYVLTDSSGSFNQNLHNVSINAVFLTMIVGAILVIACILFVVYKKYVRLRHQKFIPL